MGKAEDQLLGTNTVNNENAELWETLNDEWDYNEPT